MKILSIDVGIKNLAYCLIEVINNQYNIILWNIIDISSQSCCALCTNPGKYHHNNMILCENHRKIKQLKVYTTVTKKLETKSTKDKMAFLKRHKIKINDTEKQCKEFIATYYCKKIALANANKLKIISLGRNIKHHFDYLFDLIKPDDYVIIENQMSKLANRMKTLQGMIAQYFIHKHIKNIDFVSSQNKLKPFIKRKTTYKERKHLAIEITKKCIYNKPNWVKIFNIHSKKDDLADCYLQAISYIINSLNLKLNDIGLS